jgi:hypothetical protein
MAAMASATVTVAMRDMTEVRDSLSLDAVRRAMRYSRLCIYVT